MARRPPAMPAASTTVPAPIPGWHPRQPLKTHIPPHARVWWHGHGRCHRASWASARHRDEEGAGADRPGASVRWTWIELNEAFCRAGTCCARKLAWPTMTPASIRNGGAIALGHPLSASGARLATTAVNQRIARVVATRCTMCIGVGQGIAVILERLRLRPCALIGAIEAVNFCQHHGARQSTDH